MTDLDLLWYSTDSLSVKGHREPSMRSWGHWSPFYLHKFTGTNCFLAIKHSTLPARWPSMVHSLQLYEVGPLHRRRPQDTVQKTAAKQNINVLLKTYRNLPKYIPGIMFFINVLIFVRKIQFFCLWLLFSSFFSNNATMSTISTNNRWTATYSYLQVLTLSNVT